MASINFAAFGARVLAALKHDAARLLEQLLNDPQLPQPKPELEPGEQRAGFRNKALLIGLGWIVLRRPYLYNRSKGQGRCPLDEAWGFVDSYSPEDWAPRYPGSCRFLGAIWPPL